ncbi:MAG: sensor domain-containing diguanylate cyclase [Clostridia bacterium]|nr:sensor domain-containing diguanylate cyclase [Clostridia bacterium]
MLGYEPHEIGTSLKEWEERVHPDDIQKCFADIASHLNNETSHYENIHRMRHKDGHYVWILDRGIKLVDSEGNTYRMIGTHKDISKERYMNEQLIQLTKEDTLTKLYNRRAFFSIMSHEMAEAKRYKTDLCFMMLDIDLFKKVNDTWGHHFGDDILLNVADVIRQVIRESDYTFRLGGEEFGILLLQTDIYGGKVLGERLRKAIGDSCIQSPTNECISVTVSIGLAVYKQGMTIDMFSDKADEALYDAKRNGRNCLIVANY